MEADAKKENEKKTVAQTVKAEAESDSRETGEELVGHRLLLNEVISPTPATETTVRPKCDMVAEGQSTSKRRMQSVPRRS